MNYGEVVYVVPTTKQNTNTHTRSKTETDEALSESTQKKQGQLFRLIRILSKGG